MFLRWASVVVGSIVAVGCLLQTRLLTRTAANAAVALEVGWRELAGSELPVDRSSVETIVGLVLARIVATDARYAFREIVGE